MRAPRPEIGFGVKANLETARAWSGTQPRPVQIAAGPATLQGDWCLPGGASGLVLFVHGSGSSRLSPRNRQVARTLNESGIGTVLFDLLTPDEEARDAETGELRFDIGFLACRLTAAIRWVTQQPEGRRLRIGLFGSSTGGAAALVAAAELSSTVNAVVSRGGRPDLAGEALPQIEAPTLLIVGEYDDEVLRLNKQAFARLRCPKELAVIPQATHLFEEPGTLEEVARLATDWFHRHLDPK